nr:phytanoyl-CoA dioxygenase family protein [Burkholderia guangdongensis]
MSISQSQRDALYHDGAVLIEKCLNESQLSECYDALQWAVANPSPSVFRGLDGTALQTHIDNCNLLAKDKLDDLMMRLPFGKLFQELWGSEHVWYYAEEIFIKEGGKSGRGPWHQDTANLPWAGEHWGNAWITFQSIPKQNSLEIIRGSHHGIQYDGASFTSADDPTDPLYGDGTYPRLPHIDRDLAENPGSWDVLSWPVTPGDVVLLHPRSLHGGAPVDANCPTRHTLVVRFFGDDAQFRTLPESHPRYARNGPFFKDEMAKLNPGDPFRSPVFRQLV